jgi:DNA polymerase III sliding clamp (beta) subunit (PCNA family)
MKRTDLISTLTTVSRALEKNKEIQIYEYLCFTGESVFAFGDALGITAPLKVKQPFAVHGPTFMKLLQASVSPEIEMELAREGLLIKAGNSEYTMPVKGPDDFVWKEPEFDARYLGKEVITGIRSCLPTCSENLALEAFNRVCIKSVPLDYKITVYATDGDALTKYTTDDVLEGRDLDVCVSQAFCKVIESSSEEATMHVGSEWVMVVDGSIKIFGPNLGTSTLNYEEQIAKSLGKRSSTTLTPIPDKLFDQALTRARVVADIESAPTKLIVDNNEMLIQTLTPFGDVFDSVKVTHPDIEINVNAALIQTSIQGCTDFKLTQQSCLFTGSKVLRLVSTVE